MSAELLEIVSSTTVQVLSVGIASGFGYLFALIRKQKRSNDALMHGMQSMLRDRIIQGYNHYVRDLGYIPIYAKESLLNCFNAYETLGANGVITDLVEQIRKLPNSEGERRGKNNRND